MKKQVLGYDLSQMEARMLLDETVIDMESKDFIRRDEQNGFLLKENIN